MSCTRLIAVAIRNSEILERSFSATLPSRLSSGDSLPWVVKGVKGVYCELSWLVLEPAVRTRILDFVEASSECVGWSSREPSPPDILRRVSAVVMPYQ